MISFRFNSSLGPIWQWVNQLLCKIRFFCHSVEALKLTISEIFRTLCPFLKRGITSSRYSTVVRRSVLGKKLTMVILRVPELLKKCYVIILKNDKKLVKQKNTAEERNKRKFFFTLKETASNKLWAEIHKQQFLEFPLHETRLLNVHQHICKFFDKYARIDSTVM